MFKKGDYIYYYHRNGDTYPGKIVLTSLVLPKVRISYDGLDGQVETCVNTSKIKLQK